MGTLYLLRHGQASFGATNYDVLSPLGQRQSERLGQYWAAQGLRFDAVYSGSLQRHVDTWAGVCRGAGWEQNARPMQALNEFDSEALIAAIHPHPLERPTDPKDAKQHFRLLRDGLTQWMAGVITPTGMSSYEAFAQGVRTVLSDIRHQGLERVLIVSSGGPISTAIGQVLGVSPEQTIALNYRIRNTSVSELVFGPKRFELNTFNTLGHLDGPEFASWWTYA